jgi:uncharacterized membrane protein
MIQFTYLPSWPWIACGAALVLIIFALSYRRAKGKPTAALRLLLILLRALAIAAIVVCILDPQWVETIKHQPKSRLALLLDTSRSMSVRDVPRDRLSAAKDWVHKNIDQKTPAGVTVSAFNFDHSLAPLPALDSASPTGSVTAVSDALETLLAVPNQDPLTGVVLLSDGVDTTSNDPERVARLYRRKGIPIHTVTLGTTNETRDIIIENVQVKRAVPNEAPTRLALTLRAPGYKDKTVPIQIRRQKETIAVQEVRLTGAPQNVEIEITPRQKGFHIYEASIPSQAGEWLTNNNRRLFGLEVVDPTINVIYMEGTPQQQASPMPEWKYLKDALESDPNIKVKTLYRQFGNNGQFLNTLDSDPTTGEKIFPVEHPTKGFPRTLAGLLEYDVVIHSDIKKESFTSEQLHNIARLVEEYGGGFVMIGGNSAFGKGGYHRTVLDHIIPVAMEQEFDSDARLIKLRVPSAAYSHPIMSIGSTREETEMIWTRKFPHLYGCNRVDRAKPGAIVLAEDPSYRNAYGAGLLMAVQEIGKGRSMAFTSDTTRSWGRDFETTWGEPVRKGQPLSEYNCDSRYYRHFWVNAIRWLATGKLGRTNNPVTLELAKSYCAPSDTINARVKVRDKDLREISKADVSLFLSLGTKTNAPIKAPYDSLARAYVADLHPGQPGEFIVTAIAKGSGTILGDDRQLLVSEATDLEMADFRARPDTMAAIARASGGKTHSLTNQDTTIANTLFANVPPPNIEYRRTPIWNKWLVLTGILGLLTLEWSLRRLRGLA